MIWGTLPTVLLSVITRNELFLNPFRGHRTIKAQRLSRYAIECGVMVPLAESEGFNTTYTLRQSFASGACSKEEDQVFEGSVAKYKQYRHKGNDFLEAASTLTQKNTAVEA